MEEFLYHIAKKIYFVFKKHWFFYAIVITIPSIWFSFFIGVLGKSLGFKNQENELTSLGLLMSVIVVAIIFLLNVIKAAVDYEAVVRLESATAFNYQLLVSNNVICSERRISLIETIQRLNNTKDLAPEIVSKPRRQLKKVIQELKPTLCIIMNKKDYEFAKTDFTITLAYNFQFQESKWHWLSGITQSGQDINLIVNNPDSTFSYLLRTKETYYFKNSKEEAEAEHAYVMSSEDKTNKRNGHDIGSIFCKRYVIQKDGQIYINAFLTITTKNTKFVKNDKDRIAKENVCKNLQQISTDILGSRIESELCLLYMENWDPKLIS